MSSFRSKLIRQAVKFMTPKNYAASIPEQRKAMEKVMSRIGAPKGIMTEAVNIKGIKCEWVAVDKQSSERVILHLHGGGYNTGSIHTHRGLAAELSKASGERVLLPEYRLAPEHPFPAALDDTLSVYRWLLGQGISSSNIIISGDSAGGGLALSTVMALRDNGEVLPRALICMSPWADLTMSNETYRTNKGIDFMINIENIRDRAFMYAGGEELNNPLISPIFADFTDMPTILIQVGTDEVLLGESMAIAEKAKASCADVRLSVWEGMWHVWQLTGGMLPECSCALKEIGDFVSYCYSTKA
jgi:epsilon-lactone hydrolase